MKKSKIDPLAYDKIVEAYITELYRDLSGFISYEPGEKEVGEKDKVYLTYGEILYPSVNKMIQFMDLREDDVFYDLGSGTGKVPLQFLLKSPVRKTFGIEASDKRNDFSRKVYDQVKKECPELFKTGRELGCLQANFLNIDISDATIIYTCSTCFSEDLLKEIGKLINRCPKVRYFISMKPITTCDLPYDTILNIECTWDRTKCYVYTPGPAYNSTEPVKNQ